MLSNEALAYIAGFFDGDGAISCTGAYPNSDRHPRVQVGIAQSNPDVLERIQKEFDGRIKQHGDLSWMLWFRKKEAVPFLKAILPYLIIKRTRAVLAIQLMQRPTFKGRSVPSEEDDLRRWIIRKIAERNIKGSAYVRAGLRQRS